MKGMQAAGVMATAKHFPGHGDTATDSHHALPVIGFSRERLDSIELYPYRKLIREGVNSVMVAHLSVPELEPDPDVPSSLSRRIIGDVLTDEMGFSGLIITDALNMKGARGDDGPGETELKAFMAGNDMLLMPADFLEAKNRIAKAYYNGLSGFIAVHDFSARLRFRCFYEALLYAFFQISR